MEGTFWIFVALQERDVKPLQERERDQCSERSTLVVLGWYGSVAGRAAARKWINVLEEDSLGVSVASYVH